MAGQLSFSQDKVQQSTIARLHCGTVDTGVAVDVKKILGEYGIALTGGWRAPTEADPLIMQALLMKWLSGPPMTLAGHEPRATS